jgi:plastocyanin
MNISLSYRLNLSIIFALLLGLTLFLAACAPEGTSPEEGTPGVPGTGQDFSVNMINSMYSPMELTVPVGSTVVWNNNDDMTHTVTSGEGIFDSGLLEPGDIFTHTFNTPGEYLYFCEIHGDPGGLGMAGMIIVSDQQ